MLGLGSAPAAIQFFCLFGIPESPRYLVAKEKHEKAREALITLRGVGTRTSDTSVNLSQSEQGRQPILNGDNNSPNGPFENSADNDPIEHELQSIIRSVEDERKEERTFHEEEREKTRAPCCFPWMLWKHVLDMRHMLGIHGVKNARLVGCTLQMLQQCAGINTVMYYSGTILHNAGFATNKAIWLTAAVAFSNFFSAT